MSTLPLPASRSAPRTRVVSRGGTALDITPPFRPVDLSRFPPGTRALPIDHPRHVAVLAISDVLQVVHHDASRFLAVADHAEAVTLLHTHARFIYELAQVGLQALPLGHLKACHPRALLDAPSELDDGLDRLTLLASSEIGMASLALQWVAVAYVRLLATPPLDGEGTHATLSRQLAAFSQLRQAAFAALLEANKRMVDQLNLAPRSHAIDAAFRSLQHAVPVLALVPIRQPVARSETDRP